MHDGGVFHFVKTFKLCYTDCVKYYSLSSCLYMFAWSTLIGRVEKYLCFLPLWDMVSVLFVGIPDILRGIYFSRQIIISQIALKVKLSWQMLYPGFHMLYDEWLSKNVKRRCPLVRSFCAMGKCNWAAFNSKLTPQKITRGSLWLKNYVCNLKKLLRLGECEV